MKRLSASALALVFLTGSFLTPVLAPAYASSSALGPDRNVSLNDKDDPTKAPESLPPAPMPELKLDLPKLDQPKELPPAKHNPLKGSVQHQELLKNKQSPPQSTGTAQFDGNLRQGVLDGNANKNQLKGSAGNTRLKGQNELGLGIIGVKFVMGFGRAPIIYEVFPGTPAAEAGMHVRDIIIAVDGIPTMGLSKDEVYNMIVGPPETTVTISYKRKNDFQVKTMTRMDLNKIIDPMLRRDYLRM